MYIFDIFEIYKYIKNIYIYTIIIPRGNIKTSISSVDMR